MMVTHCQWCRQSRCLLLVLASLSAYIIYIARLGIGFSETLKLETSENVIITNIDKKENITSIGPSPAPTFPILDAVFTWVNGSDPHFIKEINAYTEQAEARRYRETGQLRYGLRSIFHYAPWIRHIYVVVSNRSTQTPSWLNTNHEQISVVEHVEIWTNKALLPCFNSEAIEAHLHRIPGLADNFLYFNDDLALTRPLQPQHLWTAPRPRRSRHDLYTIPILYQAWSAPTNTRLVQDDYGKSLVHMSEVLTERYGYRHGRRVAAHSPLLVNKAIMQESQDDLRDEVQEMLETSRFRHPKSVPYSFTYQQYVMTKHPHKVTIVDDSILLFTDITDDEMKNAIQFKRIQQTKPLFICLQDAMKNPTENVLQSIIQL